MILALALPGCAARRASGGETPANTGTNEPANVEPKAREAAETWDYDLAIETAPEARDRYEWKTSQGVEFLLLTDELTAEEIYRSGDLLSVAEQRYINLGG